MLVYWKGRYLLAELNNFYMNRKLTEEEKADRKAARERTKIALQEVRATKAEEKARRREKEPYVFVSKFPDIN